MYKPAFRACVLRFLKPGNGEVLHTVLVSSSSPKASKDGKLERFTSKSKLAGHGAREEIDHFVIDITGEDESLELFE